MEWTELADVVEVDGAMLTALKFSNGRVIGDAFPQLEIAAGDYEALKLSAVSRFMKLVRDANPGLKFKPIEYADRDKVRVLETRKGLKMITSLGDHEVEATHEWIAETDMIVVTRDEPFDITWSEHRMFFAWLKHFCALVKMYKGEAE